MAWAPPGDKIISPQSSNQWTPPGDTIVNQQQPQQRSSGNPLAGFLRGLGLGYVPDELGTLQFAATKAVHGQNPFNADGETPQQLQQASGSQDNLLSQQQLQNTGGSPLDIAKQTGRDTAGLASWLVPTARAVKTGAALGAGSGVLYGASQDNASPQSVGINGLLGLLTGGVTSKLPGMTKSVGNTLQQHGDEVLLHDLKPNATQIAKFKKLSGGQDISDYIKQMGYNGDFVNNSAKTQQGLQDAFDSLARDNTTTVPTTTLDSSFKPYVDELSANPVPAVKGKAEDLQGLLDNIKTKYGDNMTPAQITAERKNLDNLLSQGQFSMPTEQASFLKSGRDALHDAVVNATQGQTVNGMDVGQIGKELSKAISFHDIAEKQAGLGRGNKNIGLLPTLFGGSGAATGATLGGLVGGPVGAMIAAPLGAIGGLLTQKAVNSSPAVRAESNILKGAGSTLQKASSNNMANNALLRLLRNAPSSVGNFFSN